MDNSALIISLLSQLALNLMCLRCFILRLRNIVLNKLMQAVISLAGGRRKLCLSIVPLTETRRLFLFAKNQCLHESLARSEYLPKVYWENNRQKRYWHFP
jgi:hypothetical protein